MNEPESLPGDDARVFSGQNRRNRVARMGVGTVLFGAVTIYLWLEHFDPSAVLISNSLPVVFSVAVAVLAAGLVRALRNLKAPIVTVTLAPKRFRQGDPVELHWAAPREARIERLEVIAVEMRVVPSSNGTRRTKGAEFPLVDVRGAEAEGGIASVEFPVAPDRRRLSRESVEFDLRVEAETMHGRTASDTYVLGAIA